MGVSYTQERTLGKTGRIGAGSSGRGKILPGTSVVYFKDQNPCQSKTFWGSHEESGIAKAGRRERERKKHGRRVEKRLQFLIPTSEKRWQEGRRAVLGPGEYSMAVGE